MVFYTTSKAKKIHSLEPEEFTRINRGDSGFYNTIFTGHVTLRNNQITTNFLGTVVTIHGNSFYTSEDEINDGGDFRFILRYGPIHRDDGLVYLKGGLFRLLEQDEDTHERIIPGFKFPVLKSIAWDGTPASIDPQDVTLLHDMQFMREHKDEIKERMRRLKMQREG